MNYETNCHYCRTRFEDGDSMIEVNHIILVCKRCAIVKTYVTPTETRPEIAEGTKWYQRKQ